MTHESTDPVSTEDAVSELIRLRMLDAQERAKTEDELRREINALWLRVGQLRPAVPWYRRLFA